MLSYLWKSDKSQEISENEAENYLLAEKWHSYSGYADLDKIKKSIFSHKFYYEGQKKLYYYCNEDTINNILDKSKEVCNKSLRKIIRAGVPIKFTRQMLIKIGLIDKNVTNDFYNNGLASTFKNFDPKIIGNHVNYLTFSESLEENLSINFMNSDGINQVNELMWLLYPLLPQIDFCPTLIKLISLLLVFLCKSEVYCLCKNLISNDLNDLNPSKLRFIFRYTLNENRKIVQSFVESLSFITKNLGKKLSNKFNTIGFKFEKLIEDMFYNLFFGYCNFLVLQRILLLYLNEGVKIFYRVAYALLKSCINEIMDCNNHSDVYKVIKQKGMSLKEVDLLLNTAFSFKITRYNNKYNDVKIVELENRKPLSHLNYFIPTFTGSSKILLDEDILPLWKIFPDNLKMTNAKLIFSTCFNDMDLSNLYEKCRDSENSMFYCLLLIQTKTNEVFGSILSKPFDITISSLYRPSSIYLVTLKPELKRYDEVKISNNILFNSQEKLIIGNGSNGPAIEIDKHIVMGFNFPCELFNSESFLNDKKNTFLIENLEIYVLY